MDDPKASIDHVGFGAVLSKLGESFTIWLRGYWKAPRQKSKWTEIVTLFLTLGIAVAAFWSAWIFQGQLTEAKRATSLAARQWDAEHRPWVGSGDIKINQMTFYVYPGNPIQSRTQVNLVIDVPIKNAGNSPAFHVETEVGATMAEQIAAPPAIDTMMEYTCSRADGNSKNVGGVLLPNSSETRLEENISSVTPFIHITDVHRVWVAVCIAYSGATSGRQLHHTKVWVASWPIKGAPKEIGRRKAPSIDVYSLPVTHWTVVRTEAD